MLLSKMFRKLFPRKRKPLRRGKYFCEVWFRLDDGEWATKTAVVGVDNKVTYPEDLLTNHTKTIIPTEPGSRIFLDDAHVEAH